MHHWPQLQYESWIDTYETLHRWLQIVGKFRTYHCPWINHSWNSALYVTSRGLSTSAIPLGERNLTIEVDLVDHNLIIQDSTGKNEKIPLISESVASFYRRFSKIIRNFDIECKFSTTPNEVMDATAFEKDLTHCTYNAREAERCFQVLVRVSNVMDNFRANFEGKSSPVHFFWGSFDLALTFFSGRTAPEHPGGIPHLSDEVVREAYSHEVMSFGFWPGNEMYPKAAFYSYAYPEPASLKDAKLSPAEAYYHPDLREFILDYEVVRKSADPARMLQSFYQSAFDAISEKAKWRPEVLEINPHLAQLRRMSEAHRSAFDA
jgi:hypothetical protein